MVLSIVTYITTVFHEKRKATIDAFNLLQNEVLDKFASINRENAKTIIENLDCVECKEAYDGYRVLIARLEHFSIGVKKRIYDYRIVDALVGVHFICLYMKVKPIIDKANSYNKNGNDTQHYCYFVELVEKLDRKRKILNTRSN